MKHQKALKMANRNLRTIQEELRATTLFGTQFDASSSKINVVCVRLEALSGISENFEACQTEAKHFDDTVDED